MSARLTVFLPQLPARVYQLTEDEESVVGRERACAVAIDDDRVSRRHALLRPGRPWRLADLGSKNGTLLEGHRVQEAELPGDRWLSFGGLLARFEPVAPEPEDGPDEELRRLRTSIALQRELTPGAGLQALLQRLLDAFLQLADGDRGFVLLAGEEDDLEIRAARNIEQAHLLEAGFRGGVGAVSRVLRTGEPVALADLGDEASGERSLAIVPRASALVCVPLRMGDRFLGAVYADSSRAGHAYTDGDVRLLQGLADHGAMAIALARLHEDLGELQDEIAAGRDDGPDLASALGAGLERLRQRHLEMPRPAARPMSERGTTTTWGDVLASHGDEGAG